MNSRKVWAIGIVNSLKDFKIDFDEGMLNEQEEKGAYGPYKQSLRKEIYQAYAKYFIENNLAYPCFATEKELEEMSIGQKLYDYQCKSCGFEKGVLEFLIEEFRMDIIFGAIDPLEDEPMPELVCPNCR